MTPKTAPAITTGEYTAWQAAYDFFNARLWAGKLPNVLITMQRHPKSYGYFHAHHFVGRDADAAVHELAMNPDGFNGRDDRSILSTLVHEMAHVWQQEQGTAPRRAYHDREWGAEMKRVGLYPSSTAAPGGKETGQSMSHYIVDGGAYALAYAGLAATGFRLDWQSRTYDEATAKKKRASKTKYTCPECAQNVWGKPGARVACADCSDLDAGALVIMQGPPDDESGDGESGDD